MSICCLVSQLILQFFHFCHRFFLCLCNFAQNNLQFVMYSDRIVQPYWKKSSWNYKWLIVNYQSLEINYILFSCTMYLHLFKIAIYLWLGFIRDTTEFQFAFHCKMKFISFSSGEVMQHFCLFESQHAFFLL